MEDRIKHLLSQISSLEDELRTALHEREARIFFEIKGKRVEFERTARIWLVIHRRHARSTLCGET